MKLSTVAIGAFASLALAHKEVAPGVVKRHADLSKRCASGAAKFKQKRFEKRQEEASLNKRSGNSSYTIVTEGPYYDTLQNDTCVLAPDVTAGPYYWPRSETLRQDMTEDQVGVPLILDVGVLDMATCEPLPNALVAFWHCNSTGSYSSFTGRDPNTDFRELLESLNVTDFEIGTTDLHTDDTTWLRGMWPSNDEGILEMKTIFPGFYIQRSIHIHAQVFTDWVLHSNGTVKTGNTNSIGQLYFNESVSQEIMALEPYVSHTEINRTTNDVDSVYSSGLANGYNPVIDIVPLDGSDITQGMVGYITIGIDTENSPSLSGPESEQGGGGGSPSGSAMPSGTAPA
ncbi:protocatechuate 3 [Colletotrichum scovillei]|uniref:Aromatic compound dioxygenase n=1 Tax=Colletotrichum scovillei TaxID=1209932 RepID=A0A9P7UGW4_9PEZI|nr:protocatechuate 3 [Colletotrichum scovillei]KAF4774195.1 protocatechuate 3 [Colletotrichum scovillei]KAG7055959.1 aromatic compound dioxygenase [Colletotrichum scovillei]KAG7075402.1 aromatic compound dioxygenase [Colletotrichum scovillei]KAG7082289.1 aromatic compound dioxygenase [Colletotrichum scovillei]